MDWFLLGFLAGIGLIWGIQGLKYLGKHKEVPEIFSQQRDLELDELRRMAGLTTEKK
ncbi:MAG TPA: hypothetical protein VKX49_12895 [Bryobacteraceae bacterium]|nr:hypothetical protein [Bryobacteraceae bacterium]